MRKKEREITNKDDIEHILRTSRVCRIAMVDNGKPYIVPMNFGYDDGAIYLHSAKKGRKIDLIKANPTVCFEVDELLRLKKAKLACEWGAAYQSIIGSGCAVFLENVSEKKAGLDVIMGQYSQKGKDKGFEYSEEMLEKTVVIKIVIDQMTGKQA